MGNQFAPKLLNTIGKTALHATDTHTVHMELSCAV